MGYLASILFSVLCAHVSSQTIINVIHQFRQACPYTDFCQQNASLTIQDDSWAPCCRACSCADDCRKRDNCCPDKILTTETSTTAKETCKSTYVLMGDGDSFNKNDDVRKIRYFVTETCPDSESDELLKKKCNGTAAETLADIIWVSDTTTSKIYKNRFCAECNGVQNHKPWDLVTDCFDLVVEENYSLKISSYPEQCLFVTPPNKRASENVCIAPDISTCNQTGLWDVNDDVTETLCHSNPLLFVEEARGFIANIYRNIFCYKCNKPQGKQTEGKCEPEDKFVRWDLISFTALVDVFETKATIEKKRRCAVDEVEDPLKGSCLKLICPVAQFPHHGTCRRRFTTVHDLAVRVTYRLRTNWNKTRYGGKDATDYNDIDLGLAIRQQIEQLLGFEQCGRCVDMFYKSNMDMIIGNTTLSRFFDFKPVLYAEKRNCHEGVIVDAMSRLNRKEIKVDVDDDEFVIFDIEEIEDVFETEANTSQVDLPLNKPFGEYECTMFYTLNYRDLSQCPLVGLDDALYASLVSRAKSVGKAAIVKSFDVVNIERRRLATQPNSTLVCWNEYRNTIALLLNSSLKLAGNLIPFVTAALFMIWYLLVV